MTRPPLRGVLSTDVGLTVLLVSLFVVVFVIYPFVPLGGVGRLVVTAGLTVVLVSGCLSLPGRHLRLAVFLIAGVALAAHWLNNLLTHDGVLVAAHASTIVFLALTSAGTLIRVMRPGRVTSYRIQGAIAVFLMMGLIWGFAYSLVEARRPGSFHLPDAGAQAAPEDPGKISDLIYFSFVTLTTLGYGDVTPKSPSARSLATLEALVGQLYLVTLIARLVSLRAAGEQDGAPPSAPPSG